MSKLDKEEVIANFTAAYQAANGKAPTVEAKGGWYSVDGGKNIRLAALVDMTAELAGGEAPAPAEAAPAPAAKAKTAPAKKAKKAAPKAKAAPASSGKGPTVVSVGDGLKPGAYWKSQMENDGKGSTMPSGC